MELVEVMHKSLIANRMLISTDISDKNRSFILDMKEQVTASFTENVGAFSVTIRVFKKSRTKETGTVHIWGHFSNDNGVYDARCP